jgi:hypothetical protein
MRVDVRSNYVAARCITERVEAEADSDSERSEEELLSYLGNSATPLPPDNTVYDGMQFQDTKTTKLLLEALKAFSAPSKPLHCTSGESTL